MRKFIDKYKRNFPKKKKRIKTYNCITRMQIMQQKN